MHEEVLHRIQEARHSNDLIVDLSKLELVEIPAELRGFSGWRGLIISQNALQTLPLWIGEFRELRLLNLTSTSLVELHPAIGRLEQLEVLALSNNPLRRLPDNFQNLTRLLDLDLSGNRFSSLPKALRALKQLERLDISLNHIRTIPDWIGDLRNLRSFVMTGGNVSRLPDGFGRLRNLTELIITNCQLSEFPIVLRRMPSLERLYLGGNNITQIPAWVGELERLENLSLLRNEISVVPEEIGNLSALKFLDLDRNRIQTLPETIGSLKHLSQLDLTDNDLRDLPNSMYDLKRLSILYLQGNPILSIPQEVLGPGWRDLQRPDTRANPRDILDYYRRLKGAERPLNEAKLILVGRGGVGKTSLVRQLVEGVFDKDERKTEGINITEWPLRLKGVEDVRLHIWDFGGQEIMHATHQFFLTQRSIYLLVLNGRGGGEDADAEYWLKLIESFGGDSPVIIVLNKIHEHPFDLNRRALQTKYPVRAIVETDCEYSTGIEALRRSIEVETDRLEHLRDSFPGYWFTIKNKLSGMRNNYLSFEQFRAFCHDHGETEPAGQEALAGYLHTLGIVLNYRDDPRLQDTHVLNPHWVTNGIYKILNSDLLAQQKGEIRLGDLGIILEGEEYPPMMRRFILDLMRKFDLCFSFPDDDTHFLIPELLDKQEPLDTVVFTTTECLNFQYSYPILPEGLLPRFIVRTHVLSERLPRWRSGVILSFDGNKALVKADAQERLVSISILGPQAGRRRLLAVIRSDFDRIHSDIRNLQPEELIPLPQHPEVSVTYRELVVFEEQNVRTFPKVAGDQVVTVDVNELLNGVDISGTRERKKIMPSSPRPLRLFYSYSHRDETLRNELENHLKLLQRQGVIESWHDRDIEAGDEWKLRISDALERADIVLLLVSSDFLASDYCYELEMKRALERHDTGQARVIPIILRDVNWTKAPFGKLQALPKDALPVTRWPDKDSAWRDVSEGIERVVGTMRK